jgi:N-acetylglucosamine repressor
MKERGRVMVYQLTSVNKDTMKELNRMSVIEQIRKAKEISRSQISERTGLSMSSLTTIVNNLIEEELVYEIGKSKSRGGRRPVLLKFNADYGYVVGIKIGLNRLYFCRANLEAKIIRRETIEFSSSGTNEEINRLLVDGVRKVTDDCLPQERFCGIGIATSGLVDREERTVVYSPIVGWDNYSFEHLSDEFGVPVLLDNDANVFSLGYMWSQEGTPYGNFIGVLVGAGLGAGIVIDGHVYRGEFGGAGELGHTVIQQEGTPCYCGQRGCLEMYASDAFAVSEGKRLVALRLPTKLLDVAEVTPDSVLQAAREGDTYAQEILIKLGENLGIGIRNIVNFVNPGAIIVGGESMDGREYLVQGLRRELSTNFFAKHKQDLNIHICDKGTDAVLMGACALVAYDLFKVPIYV